ncbi:MAG: hypothetical protein CMJ74_08510 [Planctomycetaceae bacterium]|nr:hypothetical protein [Planctomycetaceae bacterium]|tara:strand:+ start:925 stop:1308 length:384 start_codon:yes stop_codon:yes gene_type:complete
MCISILSQDLLVTSRVAGVADSLQLPVASFSSLAHLQATWNKSPGKVVAIDLTLGELDIEKVIQWTRSQASGVKVIAFGPHVHVKKLAHADKAGCDQVYVRGEFFSQMPAIFSRLLAEVGMRSEEDQ